MANDGNQPGNQPGPQPHAEGQHGEKTHQAFIDSLHGMADDSATEGIAERGSPYGATPSDGRHRLAEAREQHDEAEKNSELKKQQLPNSHQDR